MARQIVWMPQTRISLGYPGSARVWSQAMRDALEVSDKKLIRITVISTDITVNTMFNALTSNDPYAPIAAWAMVSLPMNYVNGAFTGTLVLTRESYAGTITTGVPIDGALQRYLRWQFASVAAATEFDVSVLIEFLDAD